MQVLGDALDVLLALQLFGGQHPAEDVHGGDILAIRQTEVLVGQQGVVLQHNHVVVHGFVP